MELFKEYSAGTVVIIILLVILLGGQIASSVRSMVALKKDADKPLDDVKNAVNKHSDQISSMQRSIEEIKADLTGIHSKDTKREHDEKAEQRAILALLNHAMTGNNEHEMEVAKNDLNEVVWGEKND